MLCLESEGIHKTLTIGPGSMWCTGRGGLCMPPASRFLRNFEKGICYMTLKRLGATHSFLAKF